MILLNLIIIITITIVIFCIVNILFNDLSLPDLKIGDLKNVLVIYPHPDDELGMSAGLINKLAKDPNVNLFVISTTKGEHGDELFKLPPEELGKVRNNEFIEVMKVLGAKNYDTWDFTDGNMPEQENDIKSKIEEFIKQNSIETVVTYEKMGLYGHPDHIVLSKMVHDLSVEMNFRVLYATLPDKILKRINLPKTLTYKDRVVPLTLDTIANPEYKLNITMNLPKRYLGGTKYKSQNITGGKPLWLVNLMANYEYYTTKYE